MQFLDERASLEQERDRATVIVVDDDELMRTEVGALLTSVGYYVRTYISADEMLEKEPHPTGVAVIDLRLRGLSGLMLQQRLSTFPAIQIVFISGYAEVEDAVMAMKAGAFEFLVKPFRPQALIDAVGGAFARLENLQEKSGKSAAIRQSYESLTSTERQIAVLVAQGLRNKQIAFLSGRSENTVKVHRARIMQKMAAKSLLDLTRMLRDIGVDCEPV